MADRYFGTYHRFKTASKDAGGALMSADNLVGGKFAIEFDHDGTAQVAWLANPFGKRVGFFDPAFSRTLQVYAARGFTLVAVLSYVAFRNAPSPGEYFGECAVMAYDPADAAAFDRFADAVAARMADGVRTKVDLGPEAAQQVVGSEGAWLPKQTVPMPQAEDGVVVMKARQSALDKVVEQGRAGNKGCYVASVAILVAVVAAVLLGIASCTGLL